MKPRKIYTYPEAFNAAMYYAIRQKLEQCDAEDFAAQYAIEYEDPYWAFNLTRRFLDFYKANFGLKKSKTTKKRPRYTTQIEKLRNKLFYTDQTEIFNFPDIEPDKTLFLKHEIEGYSCRELAKMLKLNKYVIIRKVRKYRAVLVDLHKDLLE